MNDYLGPKLTPETVEDYFRARVDAAFIMSDDLQAQLELDPSHEEVRLLLPAAGTEPDVTAYERISVTRTPIRGRGGEWFRLSVDARDMHYEAYVLIESIVDQLRGGSTFRHSVSESLAGLKGLLANRRKMTGDKVAGLIGELLVLRHVINDLGEESAMSSWLGPDSEEHDFVFSDFDAEVKTTRSEARVHVIGTETQLQPSPERPLYLISTQITGAGQAAEGFTLPALIASTKGLLDTTRPAFARYLAGLGWHDVSADLYRDAYMLRSTPASYLVDEYFPAITSARLHEVVPQHQFVGGVSYRVDVTHLPKTASPSPLDNYCEVPE